MSVGTVKTRQELVKILQENRMTIFKISATWCGPCKRVDGFVRGCMAMLPDTVRIIFIDADEGSDACNFLKIKKLPSFYFYVNKERQYVLESANEREISNFFKRVHGVATCF